MQNHQRQLLDDILDSALDQLDSEEEACSKLPNVRDAYTNKTNESSHGLHTADESSETKSSGTEFISRVSSTDSKKYPLKKSVHDKKPGIAETFCEDATGNASNNDHHLGAEDFGEQLMSELMRDFEAMSGKEDATATMDVIMKQLLSRDLMYEPMKQVADKFPQWLAEKKSTLSEAEYCRYGKQYQYFQKILYLYDTEPDNMSRLIELMQDIQEYVTFGIDPSCVDNYVFSSIASNRFGQPPAEIIKELAPDLDIDSEGMPNGFDFPFPNFDGGFPPSTNGADDCKVQ
jgi:peroxin-19